MPESGPFGFVRGALSNERPYRDPQLLCNNGGIEEGQWLGIRTISKHVQ